MIDLKRELLKITDHWRQTVRNTRGAAEEIPNLLARGHMHGVSDALDLAADEIEATVSKDVPPEP